MSNYHIYKQHRAGLGGGEQSLTWTWTDYARPWSRGYFSRLHTGIYTGFQIRNRTPQQPVTVFRQQTVFDF